jgi:alpha-tubulin suppressor-like RCC1 family protein
MAVPERVRKAFGCATALAAAALFVGCGDDAADVCTGAELVGAEHALVVLKKADGSIWRWGDGDARPVPTALDGSGVSGFAGNSACVIDASGDVSCPLFEDSGDPPFAFPAHARDISLRLDPSSFRPQIPSICAVDGEGRLICRVGQFPPVSYERGPGITRVAVGADHFCAVGDDGKVFCEATNDGLVDVWERPPDEIAGAVAVVASDLASCALTGTGDVWCWGSFDYEARWPFTKPTRVLGIDGPAVALVAGGQYVCALREDGALFCWGDVASAVVPRGVTALPQQITGLPGPVRSVAGGYDFACAVVEDGTVWCWGVGYYGELGNGVTETPLPVWEPRPVVSCR